MKNLNEVIGSHISNLDVSYFAQPKVRAKHTVMRMLVEKGNENAIIPYLFRAQNEDLPGVKLSNGVESMILEYADLSLLDLLKLREFNKRARACVENVLKKASLKVINLHFNHLQKSLPLKFPFPDTIERLPQGEERFFQFLSHLDNPYAMKKLGERYLRISYDRKDKEEYQKKALDYFNKAIYTSPKNSNFTLDLGDYYARVNHSSYDCRFTGMRGTIEKESTAWQFYNKAHQEDNNVRAYLRLKFIELGYGNKTSNTLRILEEEDEDKRNELYRVLKEENKNKRDNFWKVLQEIFEKATENEDACALMELASASYILKHDEKRNAFQERCFTRAADLGHEDALEALAFRKRNSPEAAQELYERAAQKGHPEALWERARYFSLQGDENRARQYYEESAKRGHIDAFYQLGKIYLEGKGCEKNIQEAMKCFKTSINIHPNDFEDGKSAVKRLMKLVKEGQEEAKSTVLELSSEIKDFLHTYNVIVSFNEFFELIEKNGTPKSCYNIGLTFSTMPYLDYPKTGEKFEESKYWLLKAAHQAHRGAIRELGILTHLGLCSKMIDQDNEDIQPIMLLNNADQLGDNKAKVWNTILSSEPVYQLEPEALKYREQGLSAWKGEMIEEAIQHFENGEAAGDPLSCLYLSSLYKYAQEQGNTKAYSKEHFKKALNLHATIERKVD